MFYLRLIFLCCLINSVFANDRTIPIELTRTEEPILLDGILDEPIWQNVEPLKLIVYQPVYQGEMSEKTEIRIVYDANYLYVGGKMFSKNLDDIRANSLNRDGYTSDDILAIVLDTFNDNENANWFFTNPLATRFDASISNDAAGGFRATNFTWICMSWLLGVPAWCLG